MEMWDIPEKAACLESEAAQGIGKGNPAGLRRQAEELEQWNAKSVPHPGFLRFCRKKCAMKLFEKNKRIFLYPVVSWWGRINFFSGNPR
jgi:hypothetical protein